MPSFLDTLFGAFTGEPALAAADRARATLENTYGGLVAQNRWAEDTSLAETAQGAQTGRAFAEPWLNNAGANLTNWTGRGLDLLGQSFADPLQQTQRMYANALGLGGPEGTAAARAAFQAGPGYEFMLEQGLDAVARNASAAGMLASGNQLQEAQRFGTGLANQEYNNWLKNLQTREGLYAPLAARGAELYTDLGRNLGQLDVQRANFYNQSFNDEANRRAQLRLGHIAPEATAAGIFGPAMAGTNLSAGAAQSQAGLNTFNTLGNLAGSIFGGIF